jgi:hypothetical protein
MRGKVRAIRVVAAIAFLLVLTPRLNAQTVPGGVTGTGGVGTPALPALPPGRQFEFNYGVDAGIGESDNVTLVPTDRVSQTIAIADVDFDLKERSRRLDADAKGDFSYLDYLQGIYSSELIGRFDGVAAVALFPGRLNWTFQDSFGQAQIDPFAPVTPTNRENINYFSTGPDLALQFGPVWYFNAGARYIRTTYQTSPFDSTRYEASAALGTQLSAGSSVSLHGSFERALFDTTVVDGVVVNTNFNRSSVFGQYEAHGARTDLIVNLGVTKVDQGSESITGPLAKLKILRKLSAASTLTFSAGRDLTDASTGFSNLQSGAIGTVGTGPAAGSLTNYTVTYASLKWDYTRNRTTVALSGGWEKDTYDGQPQLDQQRADAEFRFERRLSRAFTAQLLGSLNRAEYPHAGAGVGYGDTDGRVGGALVFSTGKGLEVRLRYDHTSRISSGIGSGTNYQENRAFLTVGYRPPVGLGI